MAAFSHRLAHIDSASMHHGKVSTLIDARTDRTDREETPCPESSSPSTSPTSTPRSASTRSCSPPSRPSAGPGYANFAIAEPPLKLVLFEGPRGRNAQPPRGGGRDHGRGRRGRRPTRRRGSRDTGTEDDRVLLRGQKTRCGSTTPTVLAGSGTCEGYTEQLVNTVAGSGDTPTCREPVDAGPEVAGNLAASGLPRSSPSQLRRPVQVSGSTGMRAARAGGRACVASQRDEATSVRPECARDARRVVASGCDGGGNRSTAVRHAPRAHHDDHDGTADHHDDRGAARSRRRWCGPRAAATSAPR